LRGDVADAVGKLQAQSDGILAIMGSGWRLIPERVGASLRLADCVTTAGGVVIATYASGDA